MEELRQATPSEEDARLGHARLRSNASESMPTESSTRTEESMQPSPEIGTASPERPGLLEKGGDSGSEKSDINIARPGATRLKRETGGPVRPGPRSKNGKPDRKKSTIGTGRSEQLKPKAEKDSPNRAMLCRGNIGSGLSQSRVGNWKPDLPMPDADKLGPGLEVL